MYIYKIINNINNKIYIGKTINDIKKRFACHKSNANSNKNTILCKAFRKYGSENFSIIIIEENIISESVLNEKEIYWINLLKPEYNMTSGGEGVSGHSPSKETRLKISLSNKNKNIKRTIEQRTNISIKNKGKKRTKEQLENMSKSQKGKILSESHKIKISNSIKGTTKQKNVCRISDRKEMNISHFIRWDKKLKFVCDLY
jgi:group I intron endonuclease